MSLFTILKPFKFAHGGTIVEEFEPSDQPIELTTECAEVAIAEKWAKPAKAPKPAALVPDQADGAAPPAAP